MSTEALYNQRLTRILKAVALENPDEIYQYCSRLIRELGPQGFILQSGCDIPANAKLENVQAMVAAAVG
jgi:uroporphyrinogen decarboxylase